MGKRKHEKGEIARNAKERATVEEHWHILGKGKPPKRKPGKKYDYVDALAQLQFELLKLQESVRIEGLRVVVVFEGRDAAGKGGVIKRVAESLNPRYCHIVALGTPTEKERGQWYFQRYVEHLPARGEIVLFDRSWYNRAGVEHVMGFCTEAEYQEFLRSCPLFEEMLVRSGIHLIKYWFSVSDDEQEKRFLERMDTPIKRWKLSPLDMESRERWVEYSRAKDAMLKHTDRKRTPWFIVDADNKKKARLNCIAHLLHQVPYKNLSPVHLDLPPRQSDPTYRRPKKSAQRWVPERY
jgi:polyphosphate kinase 2